MALFKMWKAVTEYYYILVNIIQDILHFNDRTGTGLFVVLFHWLHFWFMIKPVNSLKYPEFK